MLAIYAAESEAKTCKAKSHKNVKTANKAVKQDDSSSKSSSSSSSSGHVKQNSGKHVSTTPPRGKAGVAGGQSINFLQKGTLSWYTDWTPTPAVKDDKGIALATMMWGLGKTSDSGGVVDNDAERFAAFKKLTPGKYKYVIGFNEPDMKSPGSAGFFSAEEGADAWNKWIVPHGEAGSVLISPSMAKQADETWLKPFLSKVSRQPDAIGVHIFQNDPSKVGRILDHFAQYNKPMWITETACINYQNGAHDYCTKEQSDNYIATVIDMFEKDDRVAAYAISDAYNGDNMALTPDHNGSKLSSAGQTFKAAIAKYASKRSFSESLDSTSKFVRKSIGSRRHHAHAQEA